MHIEGCTNIASLDPVSKTVPERCLTVAEIERKYLSFGMPLPVDNSSISVGSEESFENDNFEIYDDELLYQQALADKRRVIDELRKNKESKRMTMSEANKHHEGEAETAKGGKAQPGSDKQDDGTVKPVDGSKVIVVLNLLLVLQA